jgi:hypothetical protein
MLSTRQGADSSPWLGLERRLSSPNSPSAHGLRQGRPIWLPRQTSAAGKSLTSRPLPEQYRAEVSTTVDA